MSDNIVFLNRETARKARQARNAGRVFPLQCTGGNARVRVPNINDRTFTDSLPDHAQKILAGILLEESDKEAAKRGEVAGIGPRSINEAWRKLIDTIADQEKLANAFVVECFLDPRVVYTESELDTSDPNMVTVDDIVLADRLEFLALSLEGEAVAMRRMRPFLSGSDGGLPTQPRNEKAAKAV
jgi:co-chaperonin GroES (HSP10)